MGGRKIHATDKEKYRLRLVKRQAQNMYKVFTLLYEFKNRQNYFYTVETYH